MPIQSTTCHTCGAAFMVRSSRLSRGYGKYCSRSCLAKSRRGERASRWKGGEHINKRGYRVVTVDGYTTLEHRLVMERHLGHPIPPGYHVHHINGIKADNRIENLQVLSNSEHLRLGRSLGGRWSRIPRTRRNAGTTDRRHKAKGLCHQCYPRLWQQARLRRT